MILIKLILFNINIIIYILFYDLEYDIELIFLIFKLFIIKYKINKNYYINY